MGMWRHHFPSNPWFFIEIFMYHENGELKNINVAAMDLLS